MTRDSDQTRKPRIAMMGEFSAGKSTLANLLIGRDAIPMRVTATHLPPVWIAYGDEAPYREDLDGNRHPIEGPTLDGIPVEDTAFIRLFVEAEALELCDLIDTPGISDPNMPPEVWQRAAEQADAVLWLTHATQAWRQTEAAAWTALPETLWPRSLLLLTRIDKILTEHDRRRVLMRVRKETDGLFRQVLPISLTEASAAGDDLAKWEASGGAAFSDALLQVITDVQQELRRPGAKVSLRSRPLYVHDEPAAPEPPAPVPLRAVPDPEPVPQPADSATPSVRPVRPGARQDDRAAGQGGEPLLRVAPAAPEDAARAAEARLAALRVEPPALRVISSDADEPAPAIPRRVQRAAMPAHPTARPGRLQD